MRPGRRVFGRPLLILLLLIRGAWEATIQANVVLDWNAVIMGAIRLDNTGPTLSSRNLALLHLAMYDAVQSVVRTHQPYAVRWDAPAGTSAEAAAAAAGYAVLTALYPGIRARADETFDTWKAGQADTPSVTRGLEIGNEVARRILALRSGDGSATEVPYIPSSAPGSWRRTPPFFRPPLTPGWRYVRPFAIREVDPYVSPPPPALDSPEYARDLNEVRRLGAVDSVERTEEQSLIARFWSDFSYTAMPPGHWHEIAAGIAYAARTDLADTARLFALLSLAQADAAIVCWETKFRYNLWRPVTAIQRADEDGNVATEADPAWNHYLAAPPFPAYTSGHSTFSKASAEVLAFFYGTDAIAFTAVSDSVPGVARTFQSLAACADEVGMSRIYGGIHFGFDNREGKRCGRRIAREVTAQWLLPLADLPRVQIEDVRTDTGEATLRVHARLGTRVRLETSDDLSVWRDVGEVEGVPGGVRVQIPKGATICRFFRTRDAG